MQPWRSCLILALLGLSALPGCGGGSGTPGLPVGIEAQLDALVREQMATQNLPSVVILVSIPGEGEYRRAFGEANLATHAPRRFDDPFRIASITKTFTGTVVLALVDEGKLALTDRLSKWYPSFPNADLITVDHLLRMRSGIPDSLDAAFLKEWIANPLRGYSAAEVIARSAARASEFVPPDTVTRYTNLNFVLLEQIAVAASRQPIEALFEAHVYKPLGLASTSYPSDSELPGPNRGYLLNPATNRFEDLTRLNPATPGGAGAMISTLDDLGAYARAICTGRLIKPETQRLRLQGTTIDGVPAFVKYARGLEQLGPFCGHNGTIFGFSSEMFYLPEKDAVVVINVNRLDLDDQSKSTELFLRVTKLLFPEYVPW